MSIMKEEQNMEVQVEQQSDTEKSDPQTASEKRDVNAGSDENDEAGPHLHAKTFLAVFAVAMIYFSQVLNVVGAGSLSPAVERAFDGSTDGVWLSTSITIITVVLGVPVSRAADLWGRRWFLIGLTFCGVIGSIIIARSTSMNMAIAGEVISGLAFGAQALLHAVMAEVLPRKWRPFAQAIATVSGSVGGVVGLLAGGALTRYGNYEGFRNFWYMATAMYALSTILCFFLYSPPVRRSQLGLTNSEKLQQLDWVGYIFLTSGLVALCMGLSWSENPYGWRDAHVLAPFVTGLALLASLIVYETKVKKDGMCHHKLFSIHKWNFSIALWCIFIDGISFFATNSYFTMEVGILYDSDPLKATVRYALGFISTCVMAGLAGMYCARTKTIRAPAVFAFGVMTVFFICMATATKGSSAAVWAYAIIFGIALGGTLCSIVALSQLSTPKDLLTIATGLIISVRSFGGSIGLPLYNSIFRAQFDKNLASKIGEAVLPLGLPSSSLEAMIENLVLQNSTALADIPGATNEIISAGLNGMQEAYILGFRYVWVAAGCFTALAAISALFIVDPTKEFNMSIDAPAEEYEDLFA